MSAYWFGEISVETWDRLVLSSVTGSIFCESRFLRALEPDILYYGLYQGDELVAATLVQIDRQGVVVGPDRSFNLYHGIVLSSVITDLPIHSRVRRELLIGEAMLEGLVSRHQEIWLSLHPAMRDIRSLQWYNYHHPEKGLFQIDVRYTGILALNGFSGRDSLVSSLARGRQSDFKKSLSKGVKIISTTDAKLLDDLHEKTFFRQGAERGYFDRLLIPITTTAIEQGYGELLVAIAADGTAISASLFIWDRCTAYYLFGASDPEYRSTGAATAVLVESLWNAVQRGNSSVDFVGINSPHRGEYKTSFGAVPVPYFEAFWKSPSPVSFTSEMALHIPEREGK